MMAYAATVIAFAAGSISMALFMNDRTATAIAVIVAGALTVEVLLAAVSLKAPG